MIFFIHKFLLRPVVETETNIISSEIHIIIRVIRWLFETFTESFPQIPVVPVVPVRKGLTELPQITVVAEDPNIII